MRVVAHHCQHICCGAAREAFMGFLGGSLVCHDGVGSSIAGMDRLENVTKTIFTARTRFRLHSIPLDSHSTESRAWPWLMV